MRADDKVRRFIVRHRWLAVWAIAFVPVFFLFQPMFVWAYGWRAFPDETSPPRDSEVHDATYAPQIESARLELNRIRQAFLAPGLSVAVGIDGALVWAEALGYSDIREEIPLRLSSRFRIGSTSKALTSIGVARLIDEKRIDIDRPVTEYVEYFPDRWRRITTRHLLSHTAGIRNYEICLCFPIWEYHNTRQFDSERQAVEIVIDDELLFEPGTRYSYTSYGYNLVAAVVRSVANKPFLQYMQDAVFKPLGMSQTGPDLADASLADRVVFYEIRDGEYKEAFRVNNSNKWAGGGFLSTPTDLVAMGNALLAETFVSPATVSELLTPQPLSDGRPNGDAYALGWRSNETTALTADGEPVWVVHHGGVAMGSMSFLLLIPEYDIVISLLANRGQDDDFSFPMAKYTSEIIAPFVRQKRKDVDER